MKDTALIHKTAICLDNFLMFIEAYVNFKEEKSSEDKELCKKKLSIYCESLYDYFVTKYLEKGD